MFLCCRYGNFEGLTEEPMIAGNISSRQNLKTDPSFNWADVDWFMSSTSLPIVLKGILSGNRIYALLLWKYVTIVYGAPCIYVFIN